MQEKIIVSAT